MHGGDELRRGPISFIPGALIQGISRWGPHWLRQLLLESDESLEVDEPVFLIRVDDFPRWDLEASLFDQFDRCFEAHQIPYLLGITPWCEFYDGKPVWITGDQALYLRDLVASGRVELALHGFTHRPTRHRGYLTEIAAYNRANLRTRISAADLWFQDMLLPAPQAFIPPFNTLNRGNFTLLCQRFSAILTGPAALSSLGNFSPQVTGGTLYLPSYRPLYGTAQQISRGLETALKLNQLHAITLHWSWEHKENYLHLRELLERLEKFCVVLTLRDALAHLNLPAKDGFTQPNQG